jgi:hypothetical protein
VQATEGKQTTRILASQHWRLPARHPWLIPALASAAAVLGAALISVAPAARVSPPAAPPDPVAATQVRSEAGWILLCQLADGAIETAPGTGTISPYGANYAALGLARAAGEGHDPAYAGAAWQWLAWYQAHQDAAGFVTDYTVDGSTETSTRTYDSTDAYAGTFLSAAAATWQADPDRTRLRALAPGIGRAVSAIEATQMADGLTRAKPDYQGELLMDNAEVYGGLRAAATLATALSEPALAARATADARRVVAGVAALWNPAAGGFDWATSPHGTSVAPRWRVLYPDAMESAWAVAYGLATPAQAATVLAHLDRQQPRWADPDQSAASVVGSAVAPQPVGYWPVAGWAFTLAGQPSRAVRAAATIAAGTAARTRAWPFTAGDAGELIALQSGWPSTAPWAIPLPALHQPPSWRIIAVAAIAAVTIAAWAVYLWRRRKRRPALWLRSLVRSRRASRGSSS